MDDTSINYIEYALHQLYCSISRVEKALEEESCEDEITQAVIKTLYNNVQLLDNYIYEK